MENSVRSPDANALAGSADVRLASAWQCFDAGDVDEAIALARQVLATEIHDHSNADAALGWFLLAKGSVEEARTTLTASLARHSAYAPLHWYLGLVHLAQDHKEEACQALSNAVRLDVQLDEAAVSLAWVLGDLGRFADAVQYASHALTIRENPDRHAQLGWFLVCLGQWEEASAHLMTALAQEPTRSASRAQWALALHKLGKSERALHVLADGLALAPQDTDLLLQQTHVLLDLRRTDAARATCHRLLTLQPGAGMGWYLLSLVLLQGKRRGMALRALRRARRLAPEVADIWHQTAWLALADGDSAAALHAVERALTLAPDAPASVIVAAAVLAANGNMPAAAEHAELAVTRAERSAAAWRALAQVRVQQNRLRDARAALERALDLEPDNARDSYQQLGWLCLTERRHDEAIAAFSMAVDSHPPDAASYYGLAEAHRSAGHTGEALLAIQAALRLRPDWTSALVLHGGILLACGRDRWPEAVSQLDKALAWEPRRCETRCLLATALSRLDNSADALKILADGLLLSPDATELLQHEIGLLLDLRRTADARRACHRLILRQPLDGMHWYLLSLVQQQRKRHRMAALALVRARRLAPAAAQIWSQSAWLAVQRGDLVTARLAMGQLLALAPDDSNSEILAAAVLEAGGDGAGAAEHAQRAIARAPRSSAAWRAWAQVCAHQGRQDEACEALHTAIAMDPGNTFEAYRQLGWIHVTAQHFDAAMAAFSAAVQNHAKDAASWYGLAEACRAAGHWTQALQAIKPALSLRDEPCDLALRGQIVQQQVHQSLNETWHAMAGEPQPRLAQMPPQHGAYEFVVCSLSTKSHVPLLNTFAQSVRRHFAGRIYLLVVDSDDASLIPEGTTLVRLQDVIEPTAWSELVARYNILELCCVLKSYLMRFLAKTVDVPILYMDADTYVMGPLAPVLPASPDFSVLLTPHLLSPQPGQRSAVEIVMLSVGVFNGGVVGVGRGADRIRFLDWWRDRVTAYAYDSREQGVFTDQKWLDLVPSYFNNVHISHDAGLNVGHWRVYTERDFDEDAKGRLTFRGVPVTVMHMSGFKTNQPDRLSHNLRMSVVQDAPLGRFLLQYAHAVIQNRR